MMAGNILSARTRFQAVILSACISWLGLPASASAVDRFDVFLGFDSFVPEVSWFPIVCEIENTGPGFAGVVEVSGGSFGDGTTRRLLVELPSGTTKRITIPIFFDGGYGSGWNVRLLDEKGRIQAEQLNLRARGTVKQESVLLGSISRNGVWSPPFQKLKIKQAGFNPVASRLIPSIFPENPIVLGGLDALYLNSERVTALRQSQQSVIDQWIRTGGHLIVGVESISDVTASPWLRDLVPARLTGVKTVQAHSELQAWIQSRIPRSSGNNGGVLSPGQGASSPTLERPFADRADDTTFEATDLQVVVSEPLRGRVLVSSEGVPLMVQAPHGLGRVTVLMFSPEREPFRSWKNLPAMWSRLTEVPPEWYASTDYNASGGRAADGIFGAMIDSRQIRKLPVGWLLLLLVTYLVVIGPFDRWWLKKIGKPMLTWITFPLYVVLFSGLIYLIGYKLRAGEREWNELHVVDILSSGSAAEMRGRTYGSLYSPVNQTYRLRGPQKIAAFRGEAASAWSGGGGSEAMNVVQRDETFEVEAYVPVWTSQLYVNDWWTVGVAPLAATISEANGGLICALENQTGEVLKPVRLVWRGRVFELGELAANESKSISLKAEQGQDLGDFMSSIGANTFANIVGKRQQAFGQTASGRIENLPNGVFATTFLSGVNFANNYDRFSATPGTDLSRALEDHAIVLAWAPGKPAAPPLNQFTAKRGDANTLWRLALPLNQQP